MKMVKARYYTRDGCPLCDKGLAILCTFDGIEIEKVDIESSAETYGTYAVRIPVIQRASDGEELGWPFDRQSVARFLALP